MSAVQLAQVATHHAAAAPAGSENRAHTKFILVRVVNILLNLGSLDLAGLYSSTVLGTSTPAYG